MMITKKIVLGTYAFMLPLEKRKKHNESTHEWTCILRGQNPNENLSKFIKRVVFILHPSFANPHRIFEQFTYAAFTEYGWGEFEIICQIFFIGLENKPIELKHYLRLYPENTIDISEVPIPTLSDFKKTCVVSELYDEIVLNLPSVELLRGIEQASIDLLPDHPLCSNFKVPNQEEILKYIDLQKILQISLQNMQNDLKKDLIAKSKLVNSLMNIYYSCRPDKAINLLLQYPQILALCAGDDIDFEEKKKLIDQFRMMTKSHTTNKETVNISKEKINECLNIFKSLVQKGLLGPEFGTPVINRLGILDNEKN